MEMFCWRQMSTQSSRACLTLSTLKPDTEALSWRQTAVIWLTFMCLSAPESNLFLFICLYFCHLCAGTPSLLFCPQNILTNIELQKAQSLCSAVCLSVVETMQCPWQPSVSSSQGRESPGLPCPPREQTARQLHEPHTGPACVCLCVCVFNSNWQNLLSITKQEGWSHLTSLARLTGPGDQSQSQTAFTPAGQRLSCFLQVNFSFSNFWSRSIFFSFIHPSIIPACFLLAFWATAADLHM